jgi:hypothetical protein
MRNMVIEKEQVTRMLTWLNYDIHKSEMPSIPTLKNEIVLMRRRRGMRENDGGG